MYIQLEMSEYNRTGLGMHRGQGTIMLYPSTHQFWKEEKGRESSFEV